jgi:membrane protease YdiL (CAAX protease family)
MTLPIPDLLFTLYLLVYFPVSSLWRSRHPRPPRPDSPALRCYLRQGRYVLSLLCAFMLVKWLGGYSLVQLGMGFPSSPGGFWGLATAVCLLAGMHLLGNRMDRKWTPEERIMQEDKLRELPFPMPRTPTETLAYLVTMVGMTATWELLFRGYLLLVLTPVTGLPLAVALAAVSYGAGHGYQSRKQFFGSILAAFAFTIGYAVTANLWWLIVLHAAAPVTMLYAARKIAPRPTMAA